MQNLQGDFMPKTLFERSGGIFLDLMSCGSSIRWGVSVARGRRRGVKKTDKNRYWHRIEATVSLTDCNRTITWSGSPATMRKKLNRAIAALKNLRENIDRGDRIFRKAGGKLRDYDE
jgi:hypothetical protein